MTKMLDGNSAAEIAYQNQLAAKPEVTQADIQAAFDDLLCADLGEFSDRVIVPVRDRIDELLHALACTRGDDPLRQAYIARSIRTALRDQAWKSADEYASAP